MMRNTNANEVIGTDVTLSPEQLQEVEREAQARHEASMARLDERVRRDRREREEMERRAVAEAEARVARLRAEIDERAAARVAAREAALRGDERQRGLAEGRQQGGGGRGGGDGGGGIKSDTDWYNDMLRLSGDRTAVEEGGGRLSPAGPGESAPEVVGGDSTAAAAVVGAEAAVETIDDADFDNDPEIRAWLEEMLELSGDSAGAARDPAGGGRHESDGAGAGVMRRRAANPLPAGTWAADRRSDVRKHKVAQVDSGDDMSADDAAWVDEMFKLSGGGSAGSGKDGVGDDDE